ETRAALANKTTPEAPRKIRELAPTNPIRDDRRLSPRELQLVAASAAEMREELAPLRKDVDKASGSKKGAATKRLNRILDALLAGDELSGDDAAIAEKIDAKQLDKARDLGNGLLREVLEQAEPDADASALRELANDLCLRTDGKIQKEDLDAIVQWSLKVREMYLDMESRREDAREAAVDSVRRLEQTWQLFKELEPKLIVNDEQLFRELKDRFGSPCGFGVYFRG